MQRRRGGSGISRVALLVLVVGILVAVGFTLAARAAYDQNEDRLLERATQEAAVVLDASIPGAVSPLTNLAEVVELVEQDPALVADAAEAAFERGTYVGLSVFVDEDPTPIVALGDPKLDVSGEQLADWRTPVAATADGDPFRTIDLLRLPDPRIGYVITTAAAEPVIVYAEIATPPDRRTRIDRGEAFDNLTFALYFGDEPSEDSLVFTSAEEGTLGDRMAEERLPFGDSTLLFVASPATQLSGSTLAALPWQVALAGTIATLVAAALVESLQRRRRDAEALAATVEELYGREHAIAQTLQQSLLPRELPKADGVELAVRYIPGASGTEVGGDWYDVVELPDRRLALVVGDVAGKGVKAAAVMAAMRYGTHAIAAQDVAPDGILSRINHLEGIRGDFVTMVCALLDPHRRTLAFARAGHPCPLLITGGTASYLDGYVGPPVGFLHTSQYETEEVELAPGSTVLLFTDGLYERPGEDIDEGFERLRQVVEGFDGPLQALVDHVCDELVGGEGRDDVALLAIRLTG